MFDTPITWNDQGLVPAVIQHHRTGEVLMMAWMNKEALRLTETEGIVHFWSRSRRRLWKKGETSGNVLHLVEALIDCDGDTLVLKVRPTGPACHTGRRTCFLNTAGDQDPSPQGFADLEALWQIIVSRLSSAASGSYTTYLAEGGPQKTGLKLIEEAAELVEEALGHQVRPADTQRVREEAADLVYHLLVLLAERQVDVKDVISELAARRT